VSGLIHGYQHVPGKLFTVQDFMVRSFPDLFSVNERITSYIGTDSGFVAVCKVGATNVGRISLSYDSIISNKTFRSRKEVIYPEQERKPVERGGELGIFHLGSTVVALFEKGMVKFEPLEIGSKVRMGQRIAVLTR
jgi:phosphatidylserine decarboxylase